MKKILLFGIISCLLLSCKSDQKKDTNPTIDKNIVVEQKLQGLSPLPAESMQRLFNEVTYIDYIFYDLPFSISQDDKPSINANIKLISPEKLGGINNSCKPIGREFFHIGGIIAFEADIYFQDGCYGYVFLDKETPIYANKFSILGMKFYTNIFSQAEQIKNKALNGG
jgi:hypothetical protein